MNLQRTLWAAVIFLALLGLAVATRHTIVLSVPGAFSARNNPAAGLDAHFANHRTLTLAHVLPAMLFMILGPLQFVPSLRSKYPTFHRWSGRIFLTASTLVGTTTLTMAFGKTIGGVDEKVAVILFGTFFVIALGKALWHALRREFVPHREWMIRGYAVGLASCGDDSADHGRLLRRCGAARADAESQPIFWHGVLDRICAADHRGGNLDPPHPTCRSWSDHRGPWRASERLAPNGMMGVPPAGRGAPP